MKARLRPQRKQRRTIRVLNFGFFRARALVEVLATIMLINADGNADSRWQKEKTLTLIRVYPRPRRRYLRVGNTS
ncbi:MAG: hypothetical protein A2W52_02620 [Candidatus Taylorbacteria bacterium RIFCSPHIGHO2_02_49_25]|uniref:Uncharacterized protein n=1 Tax=Candidatus Taylorbacteria bacterium RIFCSPHIGHO2_02_49_25 TaxID=1802305 RepID=A0A1G2MBZ5_9BACT|nr:MAG: hypothetical protein A2W52_02620 [Candidatus Taylorbacteria bacterium RIFCSPHIGHO2_02_49_25]OHA21598.1 MAG: hypothetical protein A2759_01825 [Candidatus Taylorbacteria bacterium RIFCSPHIGHO2_01_FULL_49_60]OHA36799.1 MAG: hypothetical protein A3B27_00920 [Candidatus Taylorbacteria bacterium RIFCSPLOWO2_01_FULL_50_130]OHA36909.1 MAG: hypothetical protein A2W65_03795 [Candidatus Taylorbacteria bacterium RIFCSPLOWO2_02_50_13]OHA42444.1 MAG: hypothetical protein A3H73_00170 [Candidatus Taylo